MTVTGEDGSTTERDFELSVRTPNAYVTQRQITERRSCEHRRSHQTLPSELYCCARGLLV